MFSYPSSVKPTIQLVDDVKFPKLTLCSNGIHSEWKMRAKYPYLPFEVIKILIFLFKDFEIVKAINEIYSGSWNERPVSANMTIGTGLNLRSFFKHKNKLSLKTCFYARISEYAQKHFLR